jgi:Tfp pilus assembly protein PilZ
MFVAVSAYATPVPDTGQTNCIWRIKQFYFILVLIIVYISKMPEKRTYERRIKRLKLKFGESTPTSLGFTEDINPDGLFIKTTRPLSPGKKILVEISAPNDQRVFLEGYVIWIKKVPVAVATLAKKAGMAVKISRFYAGREIYMDLCKIPHR